MSEERPETQRSRSRQAEELLCELLARPLDADGVRAAWRRSPFHGQRELEGQLEELLAVRGGLERSGRAAREVLAAAAEVQGAPGEEELERSCERRLASVEPARRARGRRLELVATLAALAAVALFILWARDPRPGYQGTELLGEGDEVVLLAPVGDVVAWDAFRWRARRADECWFELTVRAADGRELAHVADLEGDAWRPGESATWPSRLSWELVAFDADGRVGTWTAEAWLR